MPITGLLLNLDIRLVADLVEVALEFPGESGLHDLLPRDQPGLLRRVRSRLLRDLLLADPDSRHNHLTQELIPADLLTELGLVPVERGPLSGELRPELFGCHPVPRQDLPEGIRQI